MDKELKREIIERVKSIVSVLVFLTVATWYWYGPRQDVTQLATNMNKYYIKSNVKITTEKDIEVNNNNYKFKVTNKTNEIQNYEIIVNNNYMKLRKNDCNLLQNNYIKYEWNTNDTKMDTKYLSVDGIIYRGVLQPNETVDFNIKMQIDKENKSKNECFYPVLNASTYYKI